MASASATTLVAVISSSRPVVIIVVVVIHVAYCYHIRGVHVIIAVPTTFLSGASVKLIFCVDITLR
jgi:hypothetical protein